MHTKLYSLLSLLAFFSSVYLYADPSSYTPIYSGTLLAFYSENISPGQLEVEPYLYQTSISGSYTQNWSFQKSKPIHELAFSLFFETGITKWLDFSLMLNTTYNQIGNLHTPLCSDTQAYLGFQVLTDIKGSWVPDIRLLLGENFPTGKYQHLNPQKQLSDSSGSGAYETSFIFVTKKIFYTFPKHPFNICLNLAYTLLNKTNVKGYNIYGGTFDTKGKILQGAQYMVDLATEYSITQNFVIGTDIHYIHQNRSTFSGNSGDANPFVGFPSSDQLSLAPCLEYNYNNNFGIFGGSWFTVAGKNSYKFITNIITVYWVF